MKNVNFASLVHSATYYLCYQNKIGRDFMLDESVLKFPISDYLSGLEMPLKQIELEYNHPYLRQRSVDLVTKESSQRNSKVDLAFEFKLAKYGTHLDPEKMRIFHDLMRLYLLAKLDKVDAYFLIAGRQSDFIQYFMSRPSNPPASNTIQQITFNQRTPPTVTGYFTEWFSFDNSSTARKKVFEVRNEKRTLYADIYKSFLDEYKPKDVLFKLELPEKIETECIEITNLSRSYPTPYIGGIWKIS